MSSDCVHDCSYCVNSTSSERGKGETHSPDEVVSRFLNMRRRGFGGGLFLSSGVRKSADTAQELLVEAGEEVRDRGYSGYLHLKVMPGAPRHLVERAAEVADRLSVNVETLPERLEDLSSTKHYRIDVERRLRWVSELSPEAGATTQLIVGGADEDDPELFEESVRLYRRFGLSRVYFSAFRPLDGTPMEGCAATEPWRETRLYRADWLYRVYDFDAEDLVRASRSGRLPRDPKEELAHLDCLRVNLDEATRDELLRVPGIGPRTAERVLEKGPEVELPRKARAFLDRQSSLGDF